MRIILLLILSQIYSRPAQAQILPSVFYQGPEEQKAFCQQTTTASQWFLKMTQTLEGHPSLQASRGLKKDVMRNLLVTWSYADLLQLSLTQRDLGPQAAGVMGHIYANASHHLGRLIRFKYWDQVGSTSSVSAADRSLMAGGLLGQAAERIPRVLSQRLMQHSWDLYTSLSWVLGATMMCGPQYALRLVEEYQCKSRGPCEILPGLVGGGLEREALHHLKAALKTIQPDSAPNDRQLVEFASAFIVFEQFYLQHTMYNQMDVGTAARLGVLDPMRFIPFEGVKSLSFKEWCQTQPNCRGSSMNLQQRTLFDQTLIAQEISEAQGSLSFMSQRRGHEMIQQVREELLEQLIDF